MQEKNFASRGFGNPGLGEKIASHAVDNADFDKSLAIITMPNVVFGGNPADFGEKPAEHGENSAEKDIDNPGL